MDEEELLKLEKLEVQRKQLDKTKEEEKAAAQVLKYLLHQIIIQYWRIMKLFPHNRSDLHTNYDLESYMYVIMCTKL